MEQVGHAQWVLTIPNYVPQGGHDEPEPTEAERIDAMESQTRHPRMQRYRTGRSAQP